MGLKEKLIDFAPYFGLKKALQEEGNFISELCDSGREATSEDREKLRSMNKKIVGGIGYLVAVYAIATAGVMLTYMKHVAPYWNSFVDSLGK